MPHCNGASLDVFPSGMARSMGGGLRAYRLTLGKQALREDLVDIFELDDVFVPSSVESQDAHFDVWLGSL